jgi:hypothetical protein
MPSGMCIMRCLLLLIGSCPTPLEPGTPACRGGSAPATHDTWMSSAEGGKEYSCCAFDVLHKYGVHQSAAQGERSNLQASCSVDLD